MGRTTNSTTRDDANRHEAAPETSKRRYWHHKPRTTAVVEFAPFVELPHEGRVFVIGMPNAQALDRWVGEHEVSIFLDGHHPVIADAERTITDAGTWWPAECDPTIALRAWRWVEAALRHEWKDDGVCLLNTPGSTGRDLWLRTPAADGCPIMSAEAQALVRSTSGQGRVETFPARAPLAAGLYEYDMRLAYAAVLRRLPMGEPAVLEAADSLDLVEVVCARTSRAEITFRPPADWSPRPGIIGVRAGENYGWSWPTEPVWHGPTWADGAEIELAVRHGWSVNVRRALVWERTGDPLRLWSDRLVSILAAGERTLSPDGFRHVRSMVRAIILHTIGAFHGAPHRVTCTAPDLGSAPIGADMLRVHVDHVSWREQRPAKWPEAVHPEWSAHVWARCRRRLLDTPGGGGMLNIEPSTLIAVRTDAVYTTAPTGWEHADDGRPGRWVLKHADGTAQPWPRTGSDVVAARKGTR